MKGDWKAVYYLNEKEVEDADVISSLENLLDRTYILNPSKEHGSLFPEMEKAKKLLLEKKKLDLNHSQTILTESKKIINYPWFKEVYSKSDKLKQFYLMYTLFKDQ